MKRNSIVIAGEGGQGIQSIAKILSSAAINYGHEVTYLPSFGVEQRGTPSVSYVVIADHEIHYSKFETADIVVILQSRAIKAIKDYISPNTQVIFDSSTVNVSDLPKTAIRLMGIPATKFAVEKFNPKSFNLIALGSISQILKLPRNNVWEEIVKVLGKKFETKKIESDNFEAFNFGYDIVFETDNLTKATFRSSHKDFIFKGHDKIAKISSKRCKGCGICLEKCPTGALSWSDELGVYGNPVPTIDLEKCIACGNCLNFCPDGAIIAKKDSQSS